MLVMKNSATYVDSMCGRAVTSFDNFEDCFFFKTGQQVLISAEYGMCAKGIKAVCIS